MKLTAKEISSVTPFRELTQALLQSLVEIALVRTFDRGDIVINYELDLILQKYICFVLDGAVAIQDKKEGLITLVFKGEYFLGRPFSMEGSNVFQSIAASDETTIVFIEKPILSKLVRLSPRFHTKVAEGYEAVFERASLLASDSATRLAVIQLIQQGEKLEPIERLFSNVRQQMIEETVRRTPDFTFNLALITIGIAVPLILAWEAGARVYFPSFSASRIVFGIREIGKFHPGAPFNVGLGIIGAILVSLTNAHTLVKHMGQRFHSLNLMRSLTIHMFVGILGPIFVFFHTGLSIFRLNLPTLAFWNTMLVLASGFFGRFIYGLIPRTIRGQKLELNALLESEEQLKRKAELLIDEPAQHREILANMVGTMQPTSFFSIISILQNMLKIHRVRRLLHSIGFAPEESLVLVDILKEEARLKRNISFLDFSNSIFKRWIRVHKPLAYCLLVLITLHVIFVTIF